ncbi:40S ribosomal protein S15-4, putative [Entamoeba invadens IP1]|uniref:40S ribosomal protein S15-4, putative n=1 Tax=Entamoeba invadens IP1 TaxID=370355 RepID=A0A0A1UES1_ENTIV|nr:40S ribosomal protein S15-4, putative [Entamoeba invadens IP1]ELP95086.1 40S ribosomal protein S15-4, putative [Entamoeba invadens IP1]|eukprot:XP_004261857.1 40S ribosomal protein S15-4, putative [Entamoeba invadens IP1]
MSDNQRQKRTFKKFEFQGKSLEEITAMPEPDFVKMLDARCRRSYARSPKLKHERLVKKLLKIKKATKADEKPKIVKTQCRNKIILPNMIGSVIGVYNGKSFTTVEIKPEMLGHYLGEFSITYKPVTHGRPGVGATHSSKFVPLK